MSDSTANTKNKSSKRFRRLLIPIILAALVILIVTLWKKPPAKNNPDQNPKPKVHFVTIGSVTDLGYTHRNYLGHLALQLHRGDQIQNFIHGNISTDDAPKFFQYLCDNSADLIFSTNPEHQQACLQVAQNNPQVTFMQMLGSQRLDNLGTYGIRDWEGAYLCGLAAALTIHPENRLAFIAPLSGPPIYWNVNAFTLGAQSINPDLTVDVVYTGSWYDPPAEIAAVKALAERSVKAIYFFTNSPIRALVAAEQQNVHVLSHYDDLSSFAPRMWITGTLWQWFPLYDQITQQILDGTWKSGPHWGGIKEGYINLAPFGSEVKSSIIEKTQQTLRKIKADELTIFSGPLHDNQNQQIIPPGQTMTRTDILTTRCYLKGIQEFTLTNNTLQKAPPNNHKG